VFAITGTDVVRLLRSREARLSHLEQRFVGNVDGRRSVAEIRVLCGLSVEELSAVLAKLTKLRVVSVEAGERASAVDALDPTDALAALEASDRPSSRPTYPVWEDPFERPTVPSDPPTAAAWVDEE
jgi:hypothetical protein